jgi:hypothetical protein
MSYTLPSPALRLGVRSRGEAALSRAPRALRCANAAQQPQLLGAGSACFLPLWFRVHAAAQVLWPVKRFGSSSLCSALTRTVLFTQKRPARNFRAHVVDPGHDGAWVDPSDADLMLSDVTAKLVAADIAPALGVTHLAPVRADAVSWPVRAVLFGVFSRVMACLVVSAPPRAREEAVRAVSVVFLLETGSPYTFLAQHTLQALGYGDSLPGSMLLNVHGVGVTVHVSRGHFADVNVLGTDFMVRARCTLTLDFASSMGLMAAPKQ